MIGTVLVGTIGYTWALFHVSCVVAKTVQAFHTFKTDAVRESRRHMRDALFNAALAFALAALTKWITGL